MKKALIVLIAIAGLAVLGYGALQIFNPFTASRQHAAQQQLRRSWGPPRITPGQQSCQPVPQPRTGVYFAIIQIPALGKDWKFTVIEGAGPPQLATGPGHIPGTAMPGAEGNAGIAAHDITAGNPFLHLASLTPGDAVIITTRNCVTTYRVSRPSYRVLYTDVAVLNPTGREHTLTLITCWPVNVLTFVPHRTIVNAIEVSNIPRG